MSEWDGQGPPPEREQMRESIYRIQELEAIIDELDATLLEIWERTSLPFNDTDRHVIQALAYRMHNRIKGTAT